MEQGLGAGRLLLSVYPDRGWAGSGCRWKLIKYRLFKLDVNLPKCFLELKHQQQKNHCVCFVWRNIRLLWWEILVMTVNSEQLNQDGVLFIHCPHWKPQHTDLCPLRLGDWSQFHRVNKIFMFQLLSCEALRGLAASGFIEWSRWIKADESHLHITLNNCCSQREMSTAMSSVDHRGADTQSTCRGRYSGACRGGFTAGKHRWGPSGLGKPGAPQKALKSVL